MWYLLVPQTLIYFACPISHEPRVGNLISGTKKVTAFGSEYWDLKLEHTESSGAADGSPVFGISQINIPISYFRGAKKIPTLSAFPLAFHPQKDKILDRLIQRGLKWARLDGCHHMRYDGVAFQQTQFGIIKAHIASRSMIDKATYRQNNVGFTMPPVNVFREESEDTNAAEKTSKPKTSESAIDELTEEQLLMATPLLYGFSLSDKLWILLVVDRVSEIQWQTDAFDNLILPKRQKNLVRALVEFHRGSNSAKNTFDDFIIGKGRGLVINLFGPPGVGKTLSAEATSEYVRRPLYVAGVDEISANVEQNLKKVFDLAAKWQAIVLIDEADVFLERRSVNDLARNALVAVFLRKLEYYEGVLFLTTNRVKVFDEAFQSRIHVSLRYNELTKDAKRQIWAAFLRKTDMDLGTMTDSQWNTLADAKVNGRQIKNAVRSSQGLASSEGEPIQFEHLIEVLSIMDQFEKDFQVERSYAL